MKKEIENKDEVHKLMKDSSIPVAVFFFYSPLCPHCIAMQEPVDILADKHADIDFFKIASENIPSDIKLDGVPHFKLMKKGKEVNKTDGEKNGDDAKEKAKNLEKDLLGGFKLGGRRHKRRRTRALRRVNTRRKVVH